ncbi:MAG TPA: hypothetical protein DIC32_02045 [Acinetobacter radioresistens]|uniref:Uncharacterized protein n=1 Tax=Acinetobacter radioresistens TaxID=40216 RepID=A0A3D3FZ06_ACIRA|nr:hypothetical protein [Acinetobacter radioresistens]
MKQATFSPVFASMYCGLCDIARNNGYALTVHGTMNLDFDLVAIPWTDQAIEPEDLIKLIADRCNLLTGQEFGTGIYQQDAEIKPHGRLAWLIIVGSGAALDISVMPKLSN